MRFAFPALFVLLLAASACREDPPPIPADPAADSLNLAGRFDTLFFDPYSSRIRMEHQGGAEGRFTKLSGYALLDTDVNEVTTMRLVLDATSAVPSGSFKEAVDWRGPRMLDAARFPELVYDVEAMRRDTTPGSNVTLLDGTLALWGQTQALPLPASVRLTGRTLAVNATVEIRPGAWDRSGAHDTTLVRIRANLVARPRDVPAPAASLRANERYQDSLARTAPLVSDSSGRD